MKKRTFKVRFFYGCRGSRLSPIFVEYRMRLGRGKLKTTFSFASALAFRYICKS